VSFAFANWPTIGVIIIIFYGFLHISVLHISVLHVDIFILELLCYTQLFARIWRISVMQSTLIRASARVPYVLLVKTRISRLIK